MKKFCSTLVATGLMLPLVAFANEPSSLQSDNNIKFYGFVRFDGTHDLGSNNTANGDWASFLQNQPIEGSNDAMKRGGTYLTARTSRFGFDGKLAGGAVGFKLEGDFNGTTAEGGQTGRAANNGTGLRIRHAYVEIQNWLVGQTWSNYEDLAGLPETVQFNPSLTAAAPRQAQVRHTFNLPASQLSFAIENGGSFVSEVVSSPISNSNFDKGVDVTARWNKSGDWGHVSARMASVGYSTTKDGVTNSARGYQAGLSGSTVVSTGKFVYGAFTGKGGGRYAWGSLFQGAVLTNDGISLFKSNGSHVGYTHNLSGTQRSNFAYSVVNFANNTNAVADVSNKKISQMHVNLISNVAKNTELGVEYAYGKRMLMNPTGNSYGIEKRINVALTTMF
jgi:DcaP outer membrane protein